jgi:hypothetical protein
MNMQLKEVFLNTFESNPKIQQGFNLLLNEMFNKHHLCSSLLDELSKYLSEYIMNKIPFNKNIHVATVNVHNEIEYASYSSVSLYEMPLDIIEKYAKVNFNIPENEEQFIFFYVSYFTFLRYISSISSNEFLKLPESEIVEARELLITKCELDKKMFDFSLSKVKINSSDLRIFNAIKVAQEKKLFNEAIFISASLEFEKAKKWLTKHQEQINERNNSIIK